MLLQWFAIATCLVVCAGSTSDPATQPVPTTAAAAVDGCEDLQQHLGESEQVLADHGSQLRQRLEAVVENLKQLEDEPESAPAAESAEHKEQLFAKRAALQDELKFLEAARTAWQAALDACQSAARFREEVEQFQSNGQHEADRFVAGDLTAISAQLDQLQNARDALQEAEAVRAGRLAELEQLIREVGDAHPTEEVGDAHLTEEARDKAVLEAEQAALSAESESTRHKRAAGDAERALLEVRLAAAREVLGDVSEDQAEKAVQAPAADEADALNKQRLAEQLDAEARDRLEFVRLRLDDIQRELEQGEHEGLETARLENEREYLKRVEGYERRRLQQAELHKRSAQQKEAIGQLRQRIEDTGTSLEQLRRRRFEMTPEERREQAAGYRDRKDAAITEAAALVEQAATEEKEIKPLQQLLPGLEAVQQALEERRREAGSFADAQRLAVHVRRMRGQLDTERQQVDSQVATAENIAYATLRRATLTRDLADLYGRCAEVLVPSEKSFWEQHKQIIDSLAILAAVIAASYAVRLLLWAIRRATAVLNTITGRRFSVKRIGTLLGFAGSILKLFIWIFGAVAVLNEFGIDPAKSSGAIGLIGLIMAGMFQQIVIDFVKGLDIVAGRHYDVGDFIEVDGKYGYVVDFNVKHTRIRTLSGQEFNIPNSRCVPSRRFPDGYVDNYVDITLKSDADSQRAKEVIDTLCPGINQRIEPVREEPEMVRRFSEPGGQAILRYRLRVLPGCGWVATDHFVPAVKKALAGAGIETSSEPVLFYINRIETFRKLFSRRLTEEEIIREVARD